jgi:hypothetical protein
VGRIRRGVGLTGAVPPVPVDEDEPGPDLRLGERAQQMCRGQCAARATADDDDDRIMTRLNGGVGHATEDTPQFWSDL